MAYQGRRVGRPPPAEGQRRLSLQGVIGWVFTESPRSLIFPWLKKKEKIIIQNTVLLSYRSLLTINFAVSFFLYSTYI